MNDLYTIRLDESGQAYIAHGERKIHKYLTRIMENGKNRYFYTMDEIAAYKREQQKKKYDMYTADYANKINEERNKQGRKNLKEEKKAQKQQAKEQKKAEKEAGTRETDLKTYLTGGDEKKEYKRSRKRLRDAEEKVRTTGDAYVQASNKNAKMSRITKKTGIDMLGTEERMRKKQQEYQQAQAELEREKKRYAEAEKNYEETSLGGQIHRTGRKTGEAVSNFIKKAGNTKVKTRKNKTDGPKSGSTR